MGQFKEIEIDKMASEERKKKIRSEVEMMFDHLRSAQAQLRSIKKHNREAAGAGQASLLQYQPRRDVSGF